MILPSGVLAARCQLAPSSDEVINTLNPTSFCSVKGFVQSSPVWLGSNALPKASQIRVSPAGSSPTMFQLGSVKSCSCAPMLTTAYRVPAGVMAISEVPYAVPPGSTASAVGDIPQLSLLQAR